MIDPKITVITPTYNRAHTLKRVFDSLKKQSFQEFKWLIMDDGSTDNTRDIVLRFQRESSFPIEYIYNKNRHKFLTVLDGIKKVKTLYHLIVDSDDSYPEDAFLFLYTEAEKINKQDEYIGIMGLSADENGKIVGDTYPNNGFDGSIFNMRYKYKVRGDKFGIFFSKTYLRQIENKDYSSYEGKGYIPQSVIFNEYDSKGLKTRFINKVVRIYHKDEEDKASVSNTRWTGKNVYGLKEGHLSFLNQYGPKLFTYPKALIRNLIGYQFYSLKNKDNLTKIILGPKNIIIKFLGIFVIPFSFLYHQSKK